MISDKRYNVRVYALLLNEKDEVLISDERRNGVSFTKFPGGGLEWGEGTNDCLKRELQEELEIEVELDELFYVNDFFQKSAFRDTDQLFSFYYLVSLVSGVIVTHQHEVPLTIEGEQFRWVKRSELSESLFTFPIDKIVAARLLDRTARIKE